MAYGVMKKLLEEAGIADIEVRTAGVSTIPGLLPTQECRQILEKEGVNIDHHRSCQLTPDLIKGATVILGMTSYHVQMALRMSEDARGKTFLLKEYVGSDPKNSQIQDPMGCTLEVYRKVYREIRAACRRLIKMDLFSPQPPARRARKAAGAVAEKTPAGTKAGVPAHSKVSAGKKKPTPAPAKEAKSSAAKPKDKARAKTAGSRGGKTLKRVGHDKAGAKKEAKSRVTESGKKTTRR
jgi:protein arginine phosphatase